MPNNVDIPNTGEEQYIPKTGSRDRGQFTGYEGVLERSERDEKAEKRVREKREPIKNEPGTVESGRTQPALGDEPH